MTNTTMESQLNPGKFHRGRFNPGRSPLLGIVAIAAAALTIGAMVLLPAAHSPSEVRIAAASRVDVQAPTQIVKLPTVEVVGTRETKTAANRWTLPAMFRKG